MKQVYDRRNKPLFNQVYLISLIVISCIIYGIFLGFMFDRFDNNMDFMHELVNNMVEFFVSAGVE